MPAIWSATRTWWHSSRQSRVRIGKMDDYRIAPHSEGALLYAPGSFGSLFGDAGRGELFSRERAIKNEVGKPGTGPIDVAISLTGTEKETLEIGPDQFAIR